LLYYDFNCENLNKLILQYSDDQTPGGLSLHKLSAIHRKIIANSLG